MPKATRRIRLAELRLPAANATQCASAGARHVLPPVVIACRAAHACVAWSNAPQPSAINHQPSAISFQQSGQQVAPKSRPLSGQRTAVVHLRPAWPLYYAIADMIAFTNPLQKYFPIK